MPEKTNLQPIRKTITRDEAIKKREEIMEVLNAGPISNNDEDLWGYVDWLNEVIAMSERNQRRK